MLNESYKLGRSDWLLVSMTRAVIHECWASEIRVRLSLPSIALAVCIVVGWEQSDQYSRLPSTKSHNSAILCDTLCFKGRRRLSAKSATLRRRCLTVCKVQVKVILSRPTSTTSMSRSTPDGQCPTLVYTPGRYSCAANTDTFRLTDREVFVHLRQLCGMIPLNWRTVDINRLPYKCGPKAELSERSNSKQSPVET